jgi:AraC family transcriptional regulator
MGPRVREDDGDMLQSELSKIGQVWMAKAGYSACTKEESTLNAASTEQYMARFHKVFAHIDAHLGEDLSVEGLSALAAFSKFHFHRQFTELFGMGVYRYVQLARLKQASYKLAFRDGQSIIDIALASAFEGPEAFSRAFRKSVGQSPSEFRKQPQWESWHAIQQPLTELRTTHMKPDFHASNVAIVDFPTTAVAAARHRGDPNHIGDAIRSMISWRKENRLPPKVSATFNILYDDPATTPAEEFRFDVCCAALHPVAPNSQGVLAQTIEGGRCAVLRQVGSDDLLGAAVHYLYGEWLPQSGEEARDYPLFVQRVRFFPDVPENEAVVDIFLPLK